MKKEFRKYDLYNENEIINYITDDIESKRMSDGEYAKYVMRCTPETLSRILNKASPMTEKLLNNIANNSYMTKETIRKFYIPRSKDD